MTSIPPWRQSSSSFFAAAMECHGVPWAGENCLIDRHGYLKIIDFGVAERVPSLAQKATFRTSQPTVPCPINGGLNSLILGDRPPKNSLICAEYSDVMPWTLRLLRAKSLLCCTQLGGESLQNQGLLSCK